MFQLKLCSINSIIIPLLDPRMVRAGLCPMAQAQQICVAWLSDYFLAQGDNEPDSRETLIQVTKREELLIKYKTEMKRRQRQMVDDDTFFELWRCLFPHSKTRPYCDLPGNCTTCADIDNGKRHATTLYEGQRYKEAHFMHRAGLFMLERDM